MKKLLLSTLALVAIATIAQAQLRFGPEVGLNMAKQSESGYTSSFQAGARIGGIADIPMGDKLALQPGIFFTMMGTKFSVPQAGDGNTKLSYIYIPINILLKFGEPEGNRFFVGAGPVIGYCFGGTETFGGTSYTVKVGSGSDPGTGYVKAIDFGADVVVGYQLSGGLIIQAGYYIGLSDIQGNSGTAYPKLTNSAVQVTLGWLFGGNSY